MICGFVIATKHKSPFWISDQSLSCKPGMAPIDTEAFGNKTVFGKIRSGRSSFLLKASVGVFFGGKAGVFVVFLFFIIKRGPEGLKVYEAEFKRLLSFVFFKTEHVSK